MKLGPVRVMGAGVEIFPCVAKVSDFLCACYWLVCNSCNMAMSDLPDMYTYISGKA